MGEGYLIVLMNQVRKDPTNIVQMYEVQFGGLPRARKMKTNGVTTKDRNIMHSIPCVHYENIKFFMAKHHIVCQLLILKPRGWTLHYKPK